MAKPNKLKLTASPTFPAPVLIPVPGGTSASVVFTFKHRTRDDFKEFVESLKGVEGVEQPEDVDILLDIASGWDLDDPFDAKSIGEMTQSYMGAAQAIINVYITELTGARTKNL